MNMANRLSKERQQWQAEEDARTMAEYQDILGDKARMGRAIKVAKRQASDLQRRANAMGNVARTGSRKRGRNE